MKTLLYNNTPISFSDTGKGPAVVLLHGFLENKKMWEAFVPILSKKNRVICIDLLGHGNSDCLGYLHTMEMNAAMIKEILRNLKVRKSIFIGHSMGGYVTMSFAKLYPNHIKGLVLLNSTTQADNEERISNRNRAIAAVKNNSKAFISVAITNLFSEKNRVLLSESIEKVKQEALKTPLQGVIASLEGMKIREDTTTFLAEINYPSMLILGKKDPVLPYKYTKLIVEKTNTYLVSLEDGHMSAIENSSELLEVLLQFLKKC